MAEVVRIKIKPLDTISKNYEEAARFIPRRYKEAIPRIEWRDPALAGQDLYAEKMKIDEVLERRKISIEKRTDAFFRDRLEKKGVPVIGPRVRAAVPDHRAGFAPYHTMLEALEIPARVVDPMENIDNRVKAVVSALIAKRKEVKGW